MSLQDQIDNANGCLGLFTYGPLELYKDVKRVPKIGGIYLLWAGDTLEYVGQSININQRLTCGHTVYDHEITTLIGIVSVPPIRRKAVEHTLIKALKPKENSTGRKPRSERVVRRSIAMYQPDWEIVETLSDELGISQNAAVRIIVRSYQENGHS